MQQVSKQNRDKIKMKTKEEKEDDDDDQINNLLNFSTRNYPYN